MQKIYTLAVLCTLVFNLKAQTIYETITSTKLDSVRELKIQLPRNYDPKSKNTYPLIIVLDGDYLFEPVAGNIDYQAYWEDIPDCIIVGIKQGTTKDSDFSFSEDTGALENAGMRFYDFIKSELIPYMDTNYKTSKFRVVVGHDVSANFINYYLSENEMIFRAYVSLSPDLTPQMTDQITEKLSNIKEEIFYYLATADTDIKAIKNKIIACNTQLKSIENPKLNYTFSNFEDANHYSIVGMGIPKALNEIFALYKPISRKEYKEDILTYEDSPYAYLIKKYETIEYFYGFKKKFIENDIRAIAAASNKKDDLDSLEKLALLVKKEFPKSMMSAYYMGMYYERFRDYKRALLQYKSGLLLNPSQYIDKDIMLDKMYEIKRL